MRNEHATLRHQYCDSVSRARTSIRHRSSLGIAQLQLPMVNRLEMERVAERASIPCEPGPERDKALLDAARGAAEYFPRDFYNVLCDLVTRETSTQAVLIDNLPVDQVLTGSDGRCRKLGQKSDISLLAIIYAAGVNAFQYLQESDAGQLIKAITPDPQRATLPFNGGRVPLGMHTDNPFLGPDFWPEIMALCCSQNVPHTATRIAGLADIQAAVGQGDPNTLERLFGKDYCHRAPNSFAFQDGRVYSNWVPVIAWRNERFEIGGGFYDGITTGRDSECDAALTAFATAAEAIATDVVLGVGQTLVWDNQTVTHSRGAIAGVGPRYLQRVFARRTFDALRKVTGNDSTHMFDCADLVPQIGRIGAP